MNANLPTSPVSAEERKRLYEAGESKYESMVNASYEKELRRNNPEAKIFDFIEQGNLDGVMSMYSDGSYTPIRGKTRYSALHKASFHGQLDICKYLVKTAGENPNAFDPVGFTPLMCAAHNGHKSVCEYLLFGAGADFWETNENGCTALQVAQKYGQDILAKYLMGCLLKLEPPVESTAREEVVSIESGSVYENSSIFKEAMGLVGSRVEVYFRPKGSSMFSKKKWMRGTVIKYDEYKVKHQVKYDDTNEVRWEYFRFKAEPKKYRLLRRAPQLRQKRGSSAALMANVVPSSAASSSSSAVPMAVAVDVDEGKYGDDEERKAKEKTKASAPIF